MKAPMIAGTLLGGLALLFQAASPPAKPPNSPESYSCFFDYDKPEEPNCLMGGAVGGLYVVPKMRKRLNYDSNGLATIHNSTYDWMYVNRAGKVIIRGVPYFDNGADDFNDGLVRFVRDGKYGYADRTGKVQIAPAYDGAYPLEKGHAIVCNACTIKSDSQGEHHWFAGGQWFLIDTKGAATPTAEPRH
jgi:hypothetical protein